MPGTYNLADLYEALADTIPSRPALACGSQSLTFAELDAQANRLAWHWDAQGVRPGDHIGLMLFNDPTYVVAMLAAFKLRAVTINVNYRYVAHEVAQLVAGADLVALVVQDVLLDVALEALPACPLVRELVVAGPDGALAVRDAEPRASDVKVRSWHACQHPRDTRGFGPRSSDDLLIVYTGGTTGMPRGVMWRHEDLFFAGLQGGVPGGQPVTSPAEVPRNAVKGEMNILTAAPMIHGSAQFSVWIAWLTGGTAGLSPGRSFDPRATLAMIAEHTMHVVNLVGDAMAIPLADALEAEPDAWDLAHLCVITSAGAILSRSVRDRLRRVLPGVEILNNFGSTESGHQGQAFYDDENPEAPPLWVMDENTAVLGDDRAPVEPGQVGWLARSGRLPLGYYKDPVKSAATFVEHDGRRWVIPGDRVRLEEDGTITLLGRGAVCINTGGEKVYPEEVEEALKAHPAVFDALVVGVPDPRWGQRVEAVLALRPGTEVGDAELDAHTRRYVAGYKTPRAWHRVTEVARHPSGKPDYGWAREVAVQNGHQGDGA